MDWVQSRRDEACFGVWLLAAAAALAHPTAREADLIGFDPVFQAAVAWILLVSGVFLRIWAAGNLTKNRLGRPAGPYNMVRHPLYLGTIVISFSFAVALGTPAGFALIAGMVLFIFLPVLRKEERELDTWFSGAYSCYARRVPALIPDPRALVVAWRTSRFLMKRCRGNFGLRALYFFPLIPAMVAGTAWLHLNLLARP